MIRASNEVVYEGVRIDRTPAIIEARYVVDILRAITDPEHDYDMPLHGETAGRLFSHSSPSRGQRG